MTFLTWGSERASRRNAAAASFPPWADTSSDVYLGTGLPKRTVIWVLEKLENLNIIERTTDHRDARVTRIELSDWFAAEIDNHFQDCLNKGI